MHLLKFIAVFTAAWVSVSYADGVGVRGKEGIVPNDTERHMAGDEFSYLEDGAGQKTQEWVRTQNSRTLDRLEKDPRFQRNIQLALRASDPVDSAGLIQKWRGVMIARDWVYQFWNDSTNPRGLWRRASLASFRAKKPEWQALVDFDQLSKAEGEPLAWISPCIISPSGRRCLLALARGGSASRVEWREFDLERRQFVANGFYFPPVPLTSFVWLTDDEMLVAADFGPGTTGPGGAPLIVKKLARGQSLLDRTGEVFRARDGDNGVFVAAALSEGEKPGIHWRPLIIRNDARDRSHFLRWNRESQLEPMTLPVTVASGLSLYDDQYIYSLHDDWSIGGKTWKAGSVVSIPVAEITKPNPRITLVMEPGSETSISYVDVAKDGLLISGFFCGKARLWRARLEQANWRVDAVNLPDNGSIYYGATDNQSDVAFFTYQNFLQPRTMYQIDVASNRVEPFHSAGAAFDSSPFITEQLEAKSSDGVMVPYFIVRPKALRYDGRAPVLMHGYGFRGGTQPPMYSPTLGQLWLAQGGVYVRAGIRGGSDRGPSWHVEGVERQHTYDDMIAVAEDLIRRGITSPKRIGIRGHSAGGLLVGVVTTKRPDLFGAAVAEAPVLDQFRMDLMIGGASIWGEFGSPDIPEERAFLERTSPFQNLKRVTDFPPLLILTSATDGHVFPAQPRRFAAKMQSLNMPFWFYETADGGHAMASTPEDQARIEAMVYTFLAQELLHADKNADS